MKKRNITIIIILGLILSSTLIIGRPALNTKNQYYIFGDHTDAIPMLCFNWTNNETYLYPFNESIFYRNETGISFDLYTDDGVPPGGDGYAGDMGHPHDQDVNISSIVNFLKIYANSFHGDGGNLTNITSGKTFSPVNIYTEAGTLDFGDLNSVITPEDDNSYNVSEISGSPPVIRILINFTGLTSFSSVIGRIYYDGGQGHEIQLEIYCNESAVWESYLEFTDMSDFINFYVPVFDPQNHVYNSNVYLRFDYVQNGIPSHNFHIDYIALVDGFTALTVADHDALGGRDNKSNHPWALPVDGSRNMTGDFLSDFFVTAHSLFGDGGNLTNITAIGDGYGGDIGHPHDQDVNKSSDVTFASITYDNSGTSFIFNSVNNNFSFTVTSVLSDPLLTIHNTGETTKVYESACRVRSASSQTVSPETWTKVIFAIEDYDQNADYNTNLMYRFVAPLDGLYFISYSVYMLNLDIDDFLISGIYKNGNLAGGYEISYAPYTTHLAHSGTDCLRLYKNDYIELYVYHNKHLATCQLPNSVYSNYMTVCKIA